MRRIARAMLAALLLTTPGLGQDTGARLEQTLSRLQAQIERLSGQVEAQRVEMAAQRAELEQLRLALAQRGLAPEYRPAGEAAARSSGAVPPSDGGMPPPLQATQSSAASAASAAAQPQALVPLQPPDKPGNAIPSWGGFRFSGDFRLRFDAALRSGNAVAAPLQNIRGRYRLLLNADKELNRQFDFHMQLATGALANPLTNDQDMAGMNVKHPFSVAEAFVDFHPHRNFSMRAGRMSDVFTERSRYYFDDDVRFNGFQQIVRLPLGSNRLGVNSIEFRSGEYLLSNPNIPVLPASSPLVAAGFQPGSKVRDAALFHPGLVINGALESGWTYRFMSDATLYRNPNQIQLASLPATFPLLIDPTLGLALSGPMNDRGNATATSDRTRYYAAHFQVLRAAYRLGYSGWKLRGRETPAWLDLRGSRNFGTSKLRDAVEFTANLGNIRQAGDFRFLYEYAIKDANSMISQFTDDDLGTGAGVNIAVHGLRFDLGLTRFLQWQNLLFIQNPRRASNPAEHLFVTVPRGAHTTFRYLSQLDFSF